ncbi:hypothetical protein [Streptomyces hundungensis]|uniref:hypothetical protein n=1 Tax=Streptomyces hundungensis TaxID=1077946 RepID=UPI0034099537
MRRGILFGTRRSKRAALARGMSGTALATAAAVLAGLMGAMPARADEPGDNPADPYARSLRLSLGEGARKDRCVLGLAVHYGGPELKTFANATLAGSDAGIAAALHGGGGGWPSKEYSDASQKDSDAASAYSAEFSRRQQQLDSDNGRYASTNASGGRPCHAPLIGWDIAGFTLEGRKKIPGSVWTDPTPHPGAESVAKAKEVYDAFDTGDDAWAKSYKDGAGSSTFGGLGITDGHADSANDIATFLRFGGFATKAPEPDSLGFRTEVENLKMAWAACDSRNPVDQYRVLTGPVIQAYGEWETEYASQANQRKDIVAAEAAASQEARTAADLMIEAIRQSWLADQILFWQQWWRERPNDLLKPSLTAQKDAARQLVLIRGRAPQLVKDANAAVARAKTAADQATAAQSSAWTVADQNNAPRGRGLMYAQTSVQIAKADYAATQAAAATVLTASKAIQANMADSQALYALAQTQSHAMNTEFRKAAALEARAQAKAAADSAEKLAKDAAANAVTAKNAQATAQSAEKTAQAGAAEAKKQRSIAETEKANAERERDTAAREREKASQAETRAQTNRHDAAKARRDAESSASIASSKRDEAEEAEGNALTARDGAAAAERNKNALESRAKALEAVAAAAVGKPAAAEARAAATDARTAANEANAAATQARSAANDASTAAVNARAAATRVQAAASRANAAANAAWAAFQTTSAAAATAHAAAAVAIDAAAAAKANADKADTEAKKAQEAARKAQSEAQGAKEEAAKTAAWSAKTAGYAYAAGQAAQGARDAATAVVKVADKAVALGSPYREADVSAAFAVLVGQTARPLGEQQASAAEAKGKEAARAATDAQALADKAAGDAKVAAQAAADAAVDAKRALASAAAARASATEADTAARAAKKADYNAQKYLAEAGADAMYAGFASTDATSAATTANRDATDAEKDAASANKAANDATTDAKSADASATEAEKDATAAEKASANADTAARDADASADRAEVEERREIEEQRKNAMSAGDTGVVGEGFDTSGLNASDEDILRGECGQQCVDDYRSAPAAVAATIVDWLKANSADILLEVIGVNNVKRCAGEGDIESCLWAVVDIATLLTVVGKLPRVAAAIATVVSGIHKFFEAAEWGKRTLTWLRTIIEKARKVGHKLPVCLTKGLVAQNRILLSKSSMNSAQAAETPGLPCLKAITAGKNFKAHFLSKKALLEKLLGKKYPKWKDDEGMEFLSDLFELVRSGRLKYEGLGTIKVGHDAALIFRGEELTLVLRIDGEFWTLLENGSGMADNIIMLP